MGWRFADELVGELTVDCLDRTEEALDRLSPEQITGPGGLLTQLAGRVIEPALEAELTEHLGPRWIGEFRRSERCPWL